MTNYDHGNAYSAFDKVYIGICISSLMVRWLLHKPDITVFSIGNMVSQFHFYVIHI